jgi:ABC-type multidrug transport system ATPase subunit
VTAPDEIEIEAANARIDVRGKCVYEGLNLRASGRRIVLAGTPTAALAAALCARGSVVSGSLTVNGKEVASAEHFGHVGIAPCDPTLPARDCVLKYVISSFRLAGLSGTDAAASARSVLQSLGLEPLEVRRPPTLTVAEKRAVALASAMIPGARVLFAESPLAGLETQAARGILELLGKICCSRAVITTALRFDAASPERELVLGADCVALLSDSGAQWTGTPESLMSGASLLAVMVRNHEHEFVERATHAGVEFQGQSPRWTVRLPANATSRVLLQAAKEADSILIEMVPLWE